MDQKSRWFSNRGQIIQTGVAGVACVFAGMRAWPDMKSNSIFSIGSLLFCALIGLVAVMLARLLLALADSRRNTSVPLNSTLVDRIGAELSCLNRFELFAVRHLCAVEGMTGEQFYAIVNELGFPILTLQQQKEIVATFERIASKTPLVCRAAETGSHWSIRADARRCVQAVVDQQKPAFGF